MHSHYHVGCVYKRGSEFIYVTEKRPRHSIGCGEHYVWRVIDIKTGRLGKEGTGFGGVICEPINCEIQIKIKFKEESHVQIES